MSILCQNAFAKLQDYQISIQTVKASRACFWQGFPDNAIDRTKQKKLLSSNGSVSLLKTLREPLQNTAKEIKLCSCGSDSQTQTMTGRVSSHGTQSDHSQDKPCFSEILQPNVFAFLPSSIHERNCKEKFQHLIQMTTILKRGKGQIRSKI